MEREFIYTEWFDKKWADCGLTLDDLIPLEQHLLKNPDTGDIIQGTGGARKIRWALPHRGKSGGIRVLYVDFIVHEKIVMFDMFTKDEKDNLTDAEKNELKQIVKEIGKELKQ